MATVKDILEFMESLYPAYMQEEWDNVGLLCGRQSKEVQRVLVALDPFEGVCREAADMGADLLVTHHPLIFTAPKAITEESSVGRCILLLAENGIAAINAHTNLDLAPGGVNDVLAQKLGLQNVQVIDPVGEDTKGQPYGLLRCGDVENNFGSAKLDLSGVQAVADDCRIDAECNFGELKLLVPRRFMVQLSPETSFGSVQTQGQPAQTAEGNITISCEANFGSIVICYI